MHECSLLLKLQKGRKIISIVFLTKIAEVPGLGCFGGFLGGFVFFFFLLFVCLFILTNILLLCYSYFLSDCIVKLINLKSNHPAFLYYDTVSLFHIGFPWKKAFTLLSVNGGSGFIQIHHLKQQQPEASYTAESSDFSTAKEGKHLFYK